MSDISISQSRLSSGIDELDVALGGGFLPGKLAVAVGATGIGKTQLGLQFAQAGLMQEGRRGIVMDMTSRGDSQNHREYAERMFGWELVECGLDRLPPRPIRQLFDLSFELPEYFRAFDYQGRRVTRNDLGTDQWHAWRQELIAKLTPTIAFVYGHFLRGARRVVVDGIEPVERASESIQYELFEYVYHQIVRKESSWVARDLLREQFRQHQECVQAHAYHSHETACLLLVTSPEVLLEELMARPISEGDPLANANTIVYLGKIREGDRYSRGMFVAKHRGSAVDERILRFSIAEKGLQAT